MFRDFIIESYKNILNLMHQRLQKNVTYNKFAELLLVIPDINACACIFYLHQPCQPV